MVCNVVAFNLVRYGTVFRWIETYTAFFDSSTFTTKNKLLRGWREFCETCDWEIFVVQVRIVVELFFSLDYMWEMDKTWEPEFPTYSSHDRENPWLAIVVSVCSDTQVYLFLKGICPVSSHKTEQRVLWRLRHDIYFKRASHLVWDLLQSCCGGTVSWHDYRRRSTRVFLLCNAGVVSGICRCGEPATLQMTQNVKKIRDSTIPSVSWDLFSRCTRAWIYFSTSRRYFLHPCYLGSAETWCSMIHLN